MQVYWTKLVVVLDHHLLLLPGLGVRSGQVGRGLLRLVVATFVYSTPSSHLIPPFSHLLSPISHLLPPYPHLLPPSSYSLTTPAFSLLQPTPTYSGRLPPPALLPLRQGQVPLRRLTVLYTRLKREKIIEKTRRTTTTVTLLCFPHCTLQKTLTGWCGR